MGLRPLACWDCGFESRQGNGCLSLASVVCFHVEFSASADRSSRGILPSVVCLSVIMKLRPWLTGGCWGMENMAIVSESIKTRESSFWCGKIPFQIRTSVFSLSFIFFYVVHSTQSSFYFNGYSVTTAVYVVPLLFQGLHNLNFISQRCMMGHAGCQTSASTR